MLQPVTADKRISVTAITWTRVLSFPNHDGLNPRNPVMIFIAAATERMSTSRPITDTVTQNGTGK